MILFVYGSHSDFEWWEFYRKVGRHPRTGPHVDAHGKGAYAHDHRKGEAHGCKGFCAKTRYEEGVRDVEDGDGEQTANRGQREPPELPGEVSGC